MIKNRINAIEYIRGISMLGVIGIHTGSQYLSNQLSNIHLVALFEIVTRFSVPIFFFVSAFGLFYNLNLNEKFNYVQFMKKRFKTVLIPYLSWSFIYLMHYTLTYGDYSPWSITTILFYLFFGLSSYQLYFLVILLWFYALMPIWIWMIKRMTVVKLALLLVFQIVFDYYSSFILSPNSSSKLINTFIEYRLNYIVLHYIFIFIWGGYCAVHYEAFHAKLQKYYKLLSSSFIVSLASLLGYYYYLIYYEQYTAESAINTAHQLSPAGIFYTIGATLFFFGIFTFAKIPNPLHSFLSILGKHSYFAYLFHPFAISYLYLTIGYTGHLMTAPITIVFYLAVAAISILVAMLMRSIGNKFPLLNILLIGIYPKTKK
ncbi:MAG: putative rane-associated acyltransferase [Massilibacillus sp.]|jgi:surface polysaccharide O-acyltransferase-like enzyme|nr:putative rane-associated acyltransferase [Massilibacillus sp.]